MTGDGPQGESGVSGFVGAEYWPQRALRTIVMVCRVRPPHGAPADSC